MENKELNKIIRISIIAGKAILEVYNSANFGIEIKKDNSPLTIADSKSNKVIVDSLSKLKIEGTVLPLLSEEGKDVPYRVRTNWKKYWLIDPLDGTKEFIKKNGEFTVNIALIENGVPIVGFVYIPVSDVLYFADKNLGSYKLKRASEIKNSDIFRYAEKLEVGKELTDTVKVVASRSHLNQETKEYIEELKKKFKKVETISSGSSIKLCMIAEGKADVYPRFAPTMEWDTAAAHAVCRYAGAEVMDYKIKKELKYNKENLLNNWFLVTGNKIFKGI